MADGIVGGVGDTDTTCPGASFGKWIFIEGTITDSQSAYGHLSLSKVYAGQKFLEVKSSVIVAILVILLVPSARLTVYAKSGAKVQTLPSKSCVGKTLTQPIAPVNAYLDPMYFTGV